MIREIISGEGLNAEIEKSLRVLNESGPSDLELVEKLSLLKHFQSEFFEQYESKIINMMGLFYKPKKRATFSDLIYGIYADAIEDKTGKRLNPFQSSALKSINSNKFFSFSAPTSSGKSFLFREIIRSASKDIVIVVPSRALISEFYFKTIQIVDEEVLVLQFFEDVNREKVSRRVFIVTPERGVELFKYVDNFDIELFLFDEAQISEEEMRGLRFDLFVRRVSEKFPKAKLIFSHPFISNPQAQLEKHKFIESSAFLNYTQHSVGKMFISYNAEGFEYFSPFSDELIFADSDIAKTILQGGGTILFYVSKAKIYSGDYLINFSKYVDECEELTDPQALEIIESLRDYIGASKEGEYKHSNFIEMMKLGVVIHHGSMPLKARLLIEGFVNKGFAKLCFSTSTLGQGVNMPFDIVWIDNFTNMDSLTLKNLIGRSGRASAEHSGFDYGYTIIKKSNLKTFKERIRQEVQISTDSGLDKPVADVEVDFKDFVEAIHGSGFDDALNITVVQRDRIDGADLEKNIQFILDNLMHRRSPISATEYYDLSDGIRTKIKRNFQDIFKAHLRRKDLTTAEAGVLSSSIPILLWRIQGKSFSEVVSMRFAYIAKRDEVRKIQSSIRQSEITAEQGREKLLKKKVRYSPAAFPLPNQRHARVPLFHNNVSVVEADYDRVVFDTYDYVDKVVSLSICDPICASLRLYYNKTKDSRALVLENYIRYGTNDDVEIWLIRYGFEMEDIVWVKGYVEKIDENSIEFRDEILDEPIYRLLVVERFI